MASSMKHVGAKAPENGDGDPTYVFVFDRREGCDPERRIKTNGLARYTDFAAAVRQTFGIAEGQRFVITTTNREEICDDDSWGVVEPGDTLYVLGSVDQELPAQAQERVTYLPHYDTIVKGGMYEYYASEGQNPLPYAFAELIDNALAATVDNIGPRKIELRLHFDDTNPSRAVIFVVDNGKGMTSHQLNNWAVYRLSKFNRREHKGQRRSEVGGEAHGPLNDMQAPRSLNSDISYFGVGGKQAIFFVGTSTRMITRPKGSKDVHELTISKDEFERKEKNQEDIYTGFIRNRKPCDASHISTDEEHLINLIKEENDFESFTAAVINGINPTHVPYLKVGHREWTRQLAHIYHYYIHGPSGNTFLAEGEKRDVADTFSNIDIQIKMYYKSDQAPKVINLRNIDDDMQTQYIRTATSTFEFKAIVEGTGIVEGVLRYHPFLYDRETYPSDALDPRAEPDPEDDHDYTTSDVRPARGRRPIFECYWNGRLIPYTSIEEFDWCLVPKKSKDLPSDCYNRISGVLWTNDKFQVSTNKLTFIDLEVKLRDKNTAYCRIMGKNEKRTSVEKEFTAWVKECHETCDKQVKFSAYKESIMRNELARNRQGPWGVFNQIEWDGKTFKKGQVVKITRTVPNIYGTIQRFLLFGDYDEEVYATGGDLEIMQEPRALHDEKKIVPLSKLDRAATDVQVKKAIEEEEAKLPAHLSVTWPEGDEVFDGEKRPAGNTIGAIKVEISNKKGEFISKLPGSSTRKLLIELKVIWHSPNGDEVIVSHISQHGKTWPYWFRKMENVKNLGPHTIQLQVVLNETGGSTFAGKPLPYQKIRFTITEADPEKFTVGLLDGPFRIGAPFTIPLEFQDEFGHPTQPNSKLKPELTATGLSLTYENTQVKGNTLLIKGIRALGSVPSNVGKNFSLAVSVPGLEESSQTLKIRMLPGLAHTMHVTPDGPTDVENGQSVRFNVEIRDKADNPTSQPKLNVTCKFLGGPTLPIYTLDCSSTGQGVLTGPSLTVKKLTGESLALTAKIDVPSVKSIETVSRQVRIMPSSVAANMELTYVAEDNKVTIIKSGQDVFGNAGELIKGLAFQISDEAGRAKESTSDFLSKVKVNWTPHIAVGDLRAGQLPDIKVPNLVTEHKYCQISVNDGSGLEFSFTVKALAGEPSQIKCKVAGDTSVRMGEKLAGDILVSVKDKYGNEIKKMEKGVLKDLSVSGDGLVFEETVRALGQVSGFNVHGIRFESGALGAREVAVSWRGLTDYVRLQMVAGPPSKLTIPNWDLSQPLTVYNESKLRQSLSVQLCDEGGNPTAEANVRVQVARDPGIKLAPSPQPLKTDKHGKADFGVLTVTGKRGVYEIQPKAFMGRTTISGPKVKISIQPDTTKPVNLQVEYDKNATYTVGQELPDFTVRVVAEDDNVMATAKASCLLMKLWHGDGSSSVKPPGKAVSHPPDTKRKNDQDGVFYFSKRRVPEVSGVHRIMFIYADNKHEVVSNQIALSVQPGPPAKLVPAQVPGTLTVSNTKNQNSRTLVKELKFELRDEYGNSTGTDIEGTLVATIVVPEGEVSTEIPNLVGGSTETEVKLDKGIAKLQNVLIEENACGKDGQEYVLRCTVSSNDIPKNRAIPAFDLPFLFYNDVKKQSQMAALTKERDSLRSAIKTYKSLFDTTQQLIDELKMSLTEAQREEQKLKTDLRKRQIPAAQLTSLMSIDDLIKEKTQDKENIMNTPRRMCGLQPAIKDPEVLGKIAHLAQVEDNDIARVLSWHMSADMDCVVTTTTRKAKEIYNMSHGKQQVLPLDSIFKKNLPDWNKPLPHERIKPVWKPTGNPCYARNLLEFPQNEDSCKIVFGMLLGDTIILDTLDHANAYRQEIVKVTHCPTILTREGDRIRSNGKFGGLMNKALPIEKLRGVVFGEPIKASYHSICTQIDLLASLRGAMERRQTAESDLSDQVASQNTPEMKSKLGECSETEEQLRAIESRLGMTPTSSSTTPRGRGRPAAPATTPDEPTPKRARGMSAAAAAVNGDTPPTPTRTSLRRAAAATEPTPTNEGASRGKRPRRT